MEEYRIILPQGDYEKMGDLESFTIKTILVFIVAFLIGFFAAAYVLMSYMLVLSLLVAAGIIFSIFITLFVYKPGFDDNIDNGLFVNLVFFTGVVVTGVILGSLIYIGTMGKLGEPFLGINCGLFLNTIFRLLWKSYLFLAIFSILDVVFLFFISSIRDELHKKITPIRS